jgi:hypothetical protein
MEGHWSKSYAGRLDTKPLPARVTSSGPTIVSGKPYKKLDTMGTSERIQQIYSELCLWMDSEHAEIATAQAVIESGWFTSYAFHNKNNPFGLSWKGYVQFFTSIEAACQAYYDQVYVKYDPESDGTYYEFLERLPYAGDSLYIWKIKHINLRLKKYEPPQI